MTTAPHEETALAFACEGDTLVGILAKPIKPTSVGIVIVVGGPQYRAGSHRQFTLLAREVANEGFASLRFDYRGMGDSTGDTRTFLDVAADIRAAIDTLMTQCPSVQSVVLWGLCDAASAALLYTPQDARISGLALANPWARTEHTYAHTQLKHYYLRRLCSKDFWRKLLRGRVNLRQAGSDLGANLKKAHQGSEQTQTSDYRHQMMQALMTFDGQTLLLLSGQDLTAQEFQRFVASHAEYVNRLQQANVQRIEIEQSDHTFSKAQWQKQMEEATVRWLKALCATITT